MNNKLPRMQRRAQRTCDIVEICRDKIHWKVQESTKQRSLAKLRLMEIEEEILRASSNGEEEVVLQRMIDDRESALKQLAFTDGMISIFSTVYNVLSDLSVQLNAVQRLGWYRYIVHLVPDKKLVKSLQSDKQRDLQSIMELTSNLLQKIEDKISATSRDKAQFESIMKHIREVGKEQNKAYEKPDRTQAVLQEILAKNQNKAFAPLPMQSVEEKNQHKNNY